MKLPALPAGGAPAADAADTLAEAARACRAVRTLTAEVAVSGKVSGQRLRGKLTVGVERPASARIEAVAPFGAPLFIFVATGEESTLLLPRDDRVLEHGAPDRVLDAAAGVPLGAADLRAALTGCLPDPEPGPLVPAGDDWRVARAANGDEAYLHRDASARTWRLVAATRRTRDGRGWRAEYRDPVDGLPRSIRLTSLDTGGRAGEAFDLTLALSQVDTNVTLDAAAFRVQIPASARPISLEELRHARPGTRED
jgi:outer membrane lipoprotein-sorting protein